MSDDSETQDPTVFFREQDQYDTILQELRQLKELVKDVQKRQGAMEKAVKNLRPLNFLRKNLMWPSRAMQ